jgi:hypothetical protein
MVQILKQEKEKQEKRKLKQKSNGSNNNKEGFFVVREGARSRDPPVNVLDTVGSVFSTFLVMIIILAVYILLGYSSACILTRYAHYVFFEKNPVDTTNPQDAFLGINKEKNGKVEFSSVYCKSKEGENKEDNKKQNPVKTMGIKKDNINHISPLKMYSYNDDCSVLENDNWWKSISAMNMSDLRQGFKSTMESFVRLNTYEQVDKTKTEDVMKSQIDNIIFPFKTIILLILALLVIIITIISGCLNGYTHNNGGIIGGIWGFIYGLIDAIPYSIYSLGFVFFPYLTQTREDFFGNIMEQPGNFSYPNFIDYLCSKGNSYILMLWSIATIITLSLSTTNFEFNSYSITSIVIGLFGLFICLYNTILDLCNENTAK